MAFLLPLLITLLIEPPFAFLLKKSGLSSYLFLVLLNAVSNPAMNALYVYAFGGSDVFLCVAEAVVYLLEATLVFFFDHRNPWAYLLVLLANLLSLEVGLLVNEVVLGKLIGLEELVLVLSVLLLLEFAFAAWYGIFKGKRKDALAGKDHEHV